MLELPEEEARETERQGQEDSFGGDGSVLCPDWDGIIAEHPFINNHLTTFRGMGSVLCKFCRDSTEF